MKKWMNWLIFFYTIGFAIEVYAVVYIALWLYGFQEVMM